MRLDHRHRLHRIVEHERARLALAVAQRLAAREILDDARLRLDIALLELELQIIVIIPAQARRQRDSRLVADVARDLRLGDRIEAVRVVVALRALAKRLPMCIRLDILLALPVRRLVAAVARELHRSLAQRDILLVAPALEHRDLRAKGLAHRGELIREVSRHRLALGVLLRLQHPLRHLHAAVRARAVRQCIDVAHTAELVDIVVIDAPRRHIRRHSFRPGQPRHHDRCRSRHHTGQQSLLHQDSPTHNYHRNFKIHENSIMIAPPKASAPAFRQRFQRILFLRQLR